MNDLLDDRQLAIEALLDIFTAWTGLPVGLYEYRKEELHFIQTQFSLAVYEQHCRFIQSFPKGKEMCLADQCNRAQGTLRDGVQKLLPCYAGMFNQVVPVPAGGSIRAVLLFGEMQIAGEDYTQTALAHHEQACRDLSLTSEESAELRDHLREAKRYSPQQLEIFQARLPQLVTFLYNLYDREQRLKLDTDKISHELGTQLQGLMANTETLIEKIFALDREQIRSRALAIDAGALALETVINNFNDFTGKYDFRYEFIAPRLHQAKSIYFAEAERYGIRIDIHFEEDPNGPKIKFSKQHLQLAFNNLMHNAIKYSFRDPTTSRRFVRIIGTPLRRWYAITFENYGVGILQDEIDSGAIFRNGYQGILTEREYRTGSGKGLFFVSNVIKKHHGDIRVTSKLVSGETHPEGEPHLNRVTVYLPYDQPKKE